MARTKNTHNSTKHKEHQDATDKHIAIYVTYNCLKPILIVYEIIQNYFIGKSSTFLHLNLMHVHVQMYMLNNQV